MIRPLMYGRVTVALTHDRVLVTAGALEDLCNRTSVLLADILQALEYNSDQAIDWAAGSTPAYITEDGAGNLSGKGYTRQAVANAIGSLDWVRKLLTNVSMTGGQGDHLGNINQLGRPLG